MTAGDGDPLLTLTRERPLVTPELHPSNDYYGNATLLKRHAGLRPRATLHAAVEHGIVLGDFVWEADLASGLPVMLCASSARAATIAPSLPDGMGVVPIGPLIHYVGRPAPPPSRSEDGVLVAFPAHSTHHIDVDYDAESFAELLCAQRPRHADVRVCLYWRDVQRGLHEPYRARGLTCVSAGHIYDPRFLPRLHAILAGAGAVATNEPGSHVIYAAALGRPVWLIDQEIAFRAPAEVQRRDGPPEPTHPWQVALRRAFGEPRTDLTAEQRELVAEIGGTGEVLGRRRLRGLLLEAATAYAAASPASRRFRGEARRLAGYGAGRIRAAAERFLD